MTPLAFSTLFVAALAVSLALRYWLAGRQVRHVARHRGAVPEAFAQRVPLQAHQRAADYTVARVRLGLLEAAFGSAVLVGFTLLGGLQWLQDAWLGLLPDAPLLRQVLLVGSVVLIGGLLDLPMDWYRQFRLEQRFGFNRMSLRLWTADLLRGAAIGAALGLPLAAAALWLMRSAGQSWWLWVWALWIAFSLFVMWLYPSVIAPLFNRFEPLPPGPVRARVEALLTRCGFAPRGLFVMDGSRRSAHGNAYFTGFGRARRIVFFDTLLSRLDEDEIEAVLAHELGHFRLKHIRKRILLGMATSLAGLWLLGLLARQPWFYQGLGVGAPVDFEALALLLFFLALPVFTFPLQPLFSMLSRRHEFEADAFAARNARATALASALVKLYEDNASTLTPDPVHSAFHDSHPPAAQRIGRLLAA
ncbi:MAG: M48 family metallopeptidase [Gammaproteobacteria bacterium]